MNLAVPKLFKLYKPDLPYCLRSRSLLSGVLLGFELAPLVAKPKIKGSGQNYGKLHVFRGELVPS